jgi:hypothetical protein
MRVSAIAMLAAVAVAAPVADYKHKDTLSVDAAAKVAAALKLNARSYESYSDEDLLKLTALLKAASRSTPVMLPTPTRTSSKSTPC